MKKILGFRLCLLVRWRSASWHSSLNRAKLLSRVTKPASLMKLCERYSKERLKMACMRVLAYGTTPSIRNINSILKSRLDIKPKNSAVKEPLQNPNRYGITRGAAYFKKDGEQE